MATHAHTQPLFVVALRYDAPDYVLELPEDGLGLQHASGVKVLIGYREPEHAPVVLTESDHDDSELLSVLTAWEPQGEPDDDDPRITEFMEWIRESHRHAANQIVGNLRWLLARPGGHRVVGRRQSARYLVRGEEHWRPFPMRRRAPLTGIVGRVAIDEAWRRAIAAATGQGWEEPVAHVLLREAREQIDTNPRSAMILTMSALEVGLKQQKSRLARAQQPPGAAGTTDVASLSDRVDPTTLIEGDLGPLLRRVRRLNAHRWIALPDWAAMRVEAGRAARNRVVHEGKEPSPREELVALARVVREILYMLDYQAGHDWALQYVGYPDGDAETVFGTPTVLGEMADD